MVIWPNAALQVLEGIAAVRPRDDHRLAVHDPFVGFERLLVGSIALDRATDAKTVLSSTAIGPIDGVESDGQGGYLVTTVMGGRVERVTASGEVRPVIAVEPFATNLAYDPAKKVVVILHLNRSKVAAYDVSAALP
ncbi:MAG: hypothetical protein FJW23_15285 [Acidimicrobiia bacterium]|nr:hypothetical protein [Acidimicrobiia bacterium]